MLAQEIEFRETSNGIQMWVERDTGPFDEYVLGVFQKDDDGFYRFHPTTGAVLTQKYLRQAAQKASELNS